MKKCLVVLVFSFRVLFQLSSQAPTVAIKQYICNSDDTYNLVIEVYGAGDISTFAGYQVDAGFYKVSSCYDNSLDTGNPCFITYPIPAPPPVCGCNGVEYGTEICAQEAGYPLWTEGPCTGNERVVFTIHNLPSAQNTTINVFRLVKVDGEEFVGPSTSIQANHTCSQATCLTCHPKSNPLTFNVTQDTSFTIEHLMTEPTQGCNLSFDRTQNKMEIPFKCSFLKGQPSALDSFWVYDLVKGDSCLSFVRFVNGGYCCKPFTPCNDGNSCTYGSYYDDDCNCIGKIDTSNKEYSFTTTKGEKIVMDNIADSCNVYVFIFYFHWCKPCQDLYKSHLPSDYDVHPNLKVIPIMMEASEANIDSLRNYGFDFINNNPFLNIVEGGETEYLADHCLNSAPTVFVKCPNKDTLLVISGTGRNQTMPEVINKVINNSCKCALANDVTISIPSKSANYLDTFTIPVTVTGFQNIESFQFPITWDTTKLERIKVHSFNNKIPGFNLGNIGLNKKGQILCVHFGEPFSLYTQDTLFQLSFKVLSDKCDSTEVKLPRSVPGNNQTFDVEVINNQFIELNTILNDSKIKLNQSSCSNCNSYISGRVYIDDKNDNKYEEGEITLKLVKVYLFKNCPDHILMDSTLTDSIGKYVFKHLIEGSYCIKLGDEFVKINNYNPSIDSCLLITNCSIDSIAYNLKASGVQGCTKHVFAHNTLCPKETDFVICDMNQIGDFPCGQMNSTINQNLETIPCSGVMHNTSYFTFLGGTGTYQINITTFSCVGPGMQYGVFETCNPSNSIICNSNPTQGVIAIDASNLEPCKKYTLWIDGFNGSVCTYYINIEGNFIPCNKDRSPQIELVNNCEGNCIIKGAEVTFEVSNPADVFSGISNNQLIWNINGQQTIINADTSLSLNKIFNTVGNLEVCVTTNEVCNNLMICKDYTIVDKPEFINPPQDVTINFSEINTYSVPFPIDYTNNMIGECNFSGSVIPMITTNVVDQIGTIVKTWKAFLCNSSDSLIHVQKITVNCSNSAYSQNIEICQGKTHTVGSNTYNLPGVYIDTLQSSIGCDSIITTSITQKPNASLSQNIQICQGELLTIGANTYSSNGQYTDTLIAKNGCDSIVSTILNVLQTPKIDNMIAICAGQSHKVGGNIYTQSGNYIDTLQSIFGCDSIINTFLTVRPSQNISFNAPDKICKGTNVNLSVIALGTYLWSDGQTTSNVSEILNENKTYQVTITDQYGCLASSSVSITVVEPKINAIPIADTLTLCFKDTIIDPYSFLAQFDANGTWSLDEKIISGQPFNLKELAEGNHTLNYGFFQQAPCSDMDTSFTLVVKDCRIMDCSFTLSEDSIKVNKNEASEISLTINDILPEEYIISIISVDPDVLESTSISDEGLYSFTVTGDFGDIVQVVYEICTPDCADCKQASLWIDNEALKDIIRTNIILPNTSGKNATLRFTDEEFLKDSELYIFNRNGDRIFHMKDYDNSWNADGYPGGIYFYVLRYRGVDIKKTLTVMK